MNFIYLLLFILCNEIVVAKTALWELSKRTNNLEIWKTTTHPKIFCSIKSNRKLLSYLRTDSASLKDVHNVEIEKSKLLELFGISRRNISSENIKKEDNRNILILLGNYYDSQNIENHFLEIHRNSKRGAEFILCSSSREINLSTYKDLIQFRGIQ